jgi:hypothetical protein
MKPAALLEMALERTAYLPDCVMAARRDIMVDVE